jgi:hypothetical protein
LKDLLQAEAARLLEQLQKERGKDILGKPAKERPTTKTLLAASPELQVAFVRQVVARFAQLGVRDQKSHGTNEWFRGSGVPAAGEEVAKLIMRKRLPFTEEMIAEMLEQIAGMDFVTFAPVMDQLVRELEKRAGEAPLSPRIRKATAQVIDELLVKHWPRALAEDHAFPRAADRKLAARLQSLLSGPLKLS